MHLKFCAITLYFHLLFQHDILLDKIDRILGIFLEEIVPFQSGHQADQQMNLYRFC